MNPSARKLISSVQPELDTLCRRFGVKKLALFGSALRATWDPQTSDLDLVADFGPPPAGVDLFAQQFVFQVELERLFGLKVDLIERSAISKPFLLERVRADAQELYAS